MAVAGATQEAGTAAGNLAQARNLDLSCGEQPAALSRQEDATSSASFDSWHSSDAIHTFVSCHLTYIHTISQFHAN